MNINDLQTQYFNYSYYSCHTTLSTSLFSAFYLLLYYIYIYIIYYI